MPRLRLRPTRRALARAGVAASAGLALSLAYAPFNLGLIALVALIPLLWMWRDAGVAEAAVLGYIAGLAFFGVTLSWVVHVGVVAVPALVAGQALYWALTGALVGLMTRLGVRSPWTIAAAWVVAEAFRGSFPLGGLAWNEIGMSLHDFSAAHALATLGGVPLLSFVVVALNGLLTDGVAAIPRLRVASAGRASSRRAVILAGAGVAVLVAATIGAVTTRFTPTPTGELRYALIQGNDQNRPLSALESAGGYLTERHLALAEQLEGDYDLIVFPESGLDTDPEGDPALRARLTALASRHNSAVLVNAITGPDDARRNTNRAYDSDGRLVGSYSKQHLVPFGEYVPLGGWPRRLVPALEAQVPDDFVAGESTVVFPLGDHKIGSVICFESAFAPLVHDSVRDGAELIVVSTNNRSYRHSALSDQHLATSQMRAAETARPVLHSSISGITGVIDADGRVVQTNPLFENAVVEGTITTTTGQTLAIRFGPWVLWASLTTVVVALAVGATRRTLNRSRPTEPDRPNGVAKPSAAGEHE